MSESTCRHCGWGIVRNFSEDWVVPMSATEAVKKCPESPDGNHEPSPEPETAPASEAQAPAVSDERPKCPDCNSVGMSHCSDPEHCGGVYWPDSKYQALRDELAQLRARVAILDAQKVELPELDITPEESQRCGQYATQVCRERQLLDALRAVQAQRTIMCDLRNGLVAARDFIDSGDSGWFPQKWRDAIAAYDALAGKDGE